MSSPAVTADAGERLVQRIRIDATHPAFDGHFPGQLILPGVALLAEVLEAARSRPELAACIGAAPRIGAVKFLSAVAPTTTLDIVFALEASTLRWHVADGVRRVASGDFARADRADAP